MPTLKWNTLIAAFLAGLAQGATQRFDNTILLESTSLRLLYQNNLNASDDQNHAGAILLDPMTKGDGETACKALDESLIYMETLQNYSSDYFYLLSYVEYAGYAKRSQQYWTQDGAIAVDRAEKGFNLPERDTSQDAKLPVLCSQSSRANGPDATASEREQIEVAAAGNVYIGFRNQKSFRFQGIRYATQPKRFEYSTVYDKTGEVLDATQYGNNCPQAQPGVPGDEDCLFLNIQTPYLPKAGSTDKLLPVIFSIHGGGLINGNGRGTTGLDGGNLASREDIVAVQINYRLGTLGFLALNGTLNGNYGLGDQVTALQWVKKNIASFGGDPQKITIAGLSSGGASVRALLGSPPVIENNLIAGAIAQSGGNFGTGFAPWLTIEQAAASVGEQIFQEAGCTGPDIDEKIICLEAVPAEALSKFKNVAWQIVQDGTFVTTSQLVVNTNNGSTAHVPVVFGVTADNAAGLGLQAYPKNPVSTLSEGIQQSLGIPSDQAQTIIDSGLFPAYDTGNITLDAYNVSQRFTTDAKFRCPDQAAVYAGSQSGVFPAAYYYEFDRTYKGIDFNNLGSELTAGPVEPGYPDGNPNKPYFRVHGGEGGFTYGNQNPLRDGNDLLASQLASTYFASFVKTGNPNPDVEYLNVRGYSDVLAQVLQSGTWDAVSSKTGPAKSLDAVARTIEFPELEQCVWLSEPVSYYLDRPH